MPSLESFCSYQNNASSFSDITHVFIEMCRTVSELTKILKSMFTVKKQDGLGGSFISVWKAQPACSMLEVGLPGVCAYAENKICPNVVGVVILSELQCLCSISRVSDFFFFFFKIYAYFKTKGIQGANKKKKKKKKKNRVQGMLLTPMSSIASTQSIYKSKVYKHLPLAKLSASFSPAHIPLALGPGIS